MNYYKGIALLFITTVLGCKKDSLKAPVPAYVKIDSISLQTSLGQGSKAHKITDAWVYVDEKQIGVFELPANVPILAEGNHLIRIFAGIQNNGIASTRSSYPFYTSYSGNINLVRDSIISLKPIVQYASFAQFAFVEDFEGVGTIFNKTANSDVDLQLLSNDNNIFEGESSGVIYLKGDNDYFECQTNNSYKLPKSGTPVFLELNYKNNNNFMVGIVANNGSQTYKEPLVLINKSEVWNKIYIDLSKVISILVNYPDIRVYIACIREAGIDAAIYLDNVKLIYQ